MYPAYDKAVKQYCALEQSRQPSISTADITRYASSIGGPVATAVEAGALNNMSSLQNQALIFYDEMFSSNRRFFPTRPCHTRKKTETKPT